MHKYIYSYKRKNVPWPWEVEFVDEVGHPQNASNCVPKIYCGDLFIAPTLQWGPSPKLIYLFIF